ncbi:MAG: hypothetical protein RSF88_11705 [Lachnospiraceae bacterium]
MLRYVAKNVGGSIRSRYFAVGVLLMIGIFFFSTGRGLLSVQVQEIPLVIQEIFRYPMKTYEKMIIEYSSASMFGFGIGNYVYLVLPLMVIGFLFRFCEERYGGYDRMILSRIGKKRYLLGTLLTSACLSIITVILSGSIITAVLYMVLPPISKGIEEMGAQTVQSMADPSIIYGNGIFFCLKLMLFASVLAVIGTWMGFLIAVITESRFLSIVTPVLVFEVWNELCQGAVSNVWYSFSVRNLVNPIYNGVPVLMYVIVVMVCLLLLGGAFYFTALKKFEKGW